MFIKGFLIEISLIVEFDNEKMLCLEEVFIVMVYI